MFKKLVNNLYIGKSKLKFYMLTTVRAELKSTNIFEKITNKDFRKSPNKYLPDVLVEGEYSTDELGNGLFRVLFGEQPSKPNTHRLYVTGIPKNTPNLDFFRIKETIWTSYYEDSHRGYLFQITDSSTPLSLLEEVKHTNNKTPIE